MIKQVKSHWYYVFWGIATVSVLTGQIYVGTGYRQMANEVSETGDNISREIEALNGRLGRALPWSM